jgi:hypothetical protein
LAREIDITLESGVCAQCHDEPWRHNKVAQWENSRHAEAIWSASFAQGAAGQNNNLQNCIRCHDAQGYVNFTKGRTTNTTGMVAGSHVAITCQTCHDPHGNSNVASLRSSPAGSDTLGNGYRYTGGGLGRLCMDCHKGRRGAETYSQTQVTSSHWGTHYSVQADNLIGRNSVQFGSSYASSPHYLATQNTCVTCHMVATVDTGSVNRDKVGDHTFRLHNPETGYDHTASCTPCHGQKASFEDFIAKMDYDGDGQVESIREEYHGLVDMLAMWLPPRGETTISWEAIRDADSLILRQAYWNWQMIEHDGSGGMHNPMYAIDVLRKTIQALGGTLTSVQIDDPEIPETFVLAQNYPNPFNPSTTIRYSVPFESLVKINVYSLTGELIKEVENKVHTTGTYETMFSTYSAGKELASGVYFYNIEATSIDGSRTFRESRKMILMK